MTGVEQYNKFNKKQRQVCRKDNLKPIKIENTENREDDEKFLLHLY